MEEASSHARKMNRSLYDATWESNGMAPSPEEWAYLQDFILHECDKICGGQPGDDLVRGVLAQALWAHREEKASSERCERMKQTFISLLVPQFERMQELRRDIRAKFISPPIPQRQLKAVS